MGMWMNRAWLLLALPFLMGQTLRDVTVRDVVLGSAGGGGTEQMLPTTLSDVAASSWRTGAVANVADCNGSEATCLGYVDEGYQATYDDERMCNDENVAPPVDTVRFDFNTPSNAPSATSNAQSIRVVTIRTNATCTASGFNTADPTFDIQVYDGTSVTLIANDISCTDDTAVAEATYSWTYTGGSTGAEVYVVWQDNGNTQTGTNRRRCALETIDWLEAY
jgi:hypothetical protein